MKFLGIIPARYESTRFPGKPLIQIKGKPMIQWVYEKAMPVVDYLCVATDDARIADVVKKFNGNAVMTSSSHRSGTDRCAEAARKLSEKINCNVVINIQGDEPFIRPDEILQLKSCFEQGAQIATLIKKLENTVDVFNPNQPKVVIDKENNALYFSRSPIPFIRNEREENWVKRNIWGHIGIYAFLENVLQEITRLPPGELEQAESLEQLRWLEHGYKIKTAVTNYQSFGIDTPDDLKQALRLLEQNLVS